MLLEGCTTGIMIGSHDKIDLQEGKLDTIHYWHLGNLYALWLSISWREVLTFVKFLNSSSLLWSAGI